MTRFIKPLPFMLAFSICLTLTASAWMLTHYSNTDNKLAPYTAPAGQESQILQSGCGANGGCGDSARVQDTPANGCGANGTSCCTDETTQVSATVSTNSGCCGGNTQK